MKLLLISGLLFTTCLVLPPKICAGDVADSFDLPDTDWVSANHSISDKYLMHSGKARVQDKKIVTASTENSEANDIFLVEPLPVEAGDQPYTMSIDFMTSDVETIGGVAFTFNYLNSQSLAYFRLRTQAGKSVVQLILYKNGRTTPPVSAAIPAAIAPGTWYRFSVRAPKSDESQYEFKITEAGDSNNVVADGSIVDHLSGDDPLVGGQVGFGAYGPSHTLDNFKLHFGP